MSSEPPVVGALVCKWKQVAGSEWVRHSFQFVYETEPVSPWDVAVYLFCSLQGSAEHEVVTDDFGALARAYRAAFQYAWEVEE